MASIGRCRSRSPFYVLRLAHGDFGPSLVYRDFTVSDLIARGLPVSLTLGGLAPRSSRLALGIGERDRRRHAGPDDRSIMR